MAQLNNLETKFTSQEQQKQYEKSCKAEFDDTKTKGGDKSSEKWRIDESGKFRFSTHSQLESWMRDRKLYNHLDSTEFEAVLGNPTEKDEKSGDKKGGADFKRMLEEIGYVVWHPRELDKQGVLTENEGKIQFKKKL